MGRSDAERIEQLEVYWPTTGTTDVYRDVPLDQQIRIVEGEANFTVVPLKSFAFGKTTP